MKSGIYIDDQFIGVTADAVGLYFDIIRKLIDSKNSARLTLPTSDGVFSILIDRNTRLRSIVALEESSDFTAGSLAENPFGNLPTLIQDRVDRDSELWERIGETNLGDAIKHLEADE